MTQNIKSTGRKPDYTADGVAIWVNTDKNGQDYLSVKILGSITVNAFKPKAVSEAQPETKAVTPQYEDKYDVSIDAQQEILNEAI